MPRVVRHQRARRDVLGIVEYLDAEAGSKTGDRFLDAVEKAILSFAEMPRIAQTVQGMRFRHRDVRAWRLPGFGNYILFYRPLPIDGIEVLRVRHGARDFAGVFSEDAVPIV